MTLIEIVSKISGLEVSEEDAMVYARDNFNYIIRFIIKEEIDKTKIFISLNDSIGNLITTIEKLQNKNQHYKRVLETIYNWELPKSGHYWNDGSEMNYGSAFGSNGERDYIRTIAKKALSEEENENENKEHSECK